MIHKTKNTVFGWKPSLLQKQYTDAREKTLKESGFSLEKFKKWQEKMIEKSSTEE